MTIYEVIFSKISTMNPTHLESLALGHHRTLNGLAAEAFAEIARIAEEMGPENLAHFHAGMIC